VAVAVIFAAAAVDAADGAAVVAPIAVATAEDADAKDATAANCLNRNMRRTGHTTTPRQKPHRRMVTSR
jgi:hypothetical protein